MELQPFVLTANWVKIVRYTGETQNECDILYYKTKPLVEVNFLFFYFAEVEGGGGGADADSGGGGFLVEGISIHIEGDCKKSTCR